MRGGGSLRIAILAPPWYPVPPPRYGGIEAVVALLADGLVAAGHDVTLFASGDSRTSARLVSVFDQAPSSELGMFDPALRHASALLDQADRFDVVSDHIGTLGLLLAPLHGVRTLSTVHGPVAEWQGQAYAGLCRRVRGAALVSLSLAQRAPQPDLPWVANIPNAIDLAAHPCRTRAGGDYLLWFGRMSPEKGPHHAIRVAREAGWPLKLAGRVQEPREHAFFRDTVRPLLGGDAEYLGEVSHQHRIALMLGARALLFPICWPEPFGLVMIEAMACGVPVVATRQGAVPEIVEDGRSGVIVDTVAEMAAALDRAFALEPRQCRSVVEERFSSQRMVAAYAAALRRIALPPGRTWGGRSA
jgi:glycosyltransferase involved in cell wall biosynthesis